MKKDSYSIQDNVSANQAEELSNRQLSIYQLNPQQQEEQKIIQKQQEQIPNSEVIKNRSQLKEKEKKMHETFVRLRLKVAAKKLVNETNSRMFQDLQPIQYYLINDKATSLDNVQLVHQGNIKSLNTLANQQATLKLKGKDIKLTLQNDFANLIHCTIFKQIGKLFHKIPVISPSSLFKYTWDFFHVSMILIYLFLIPIHISFGIPFAQLATPAIADLAPISFIVDTLINLSTGYYDKGVAVENKWKIFKNYIQKNFLTDILAVIPNIIYHYSLNQDIEYQDLTAPPEVKADFKFILKFFLLFFFMKLNSFNDIIKKLEARSHLSKKISNIIQFIKLLFTIVIIAHNFACLWVFVANIETNYGMQTWMDYQEISAADWKVKYIRAYYFSVVTMITVGYGDVLPKTDYEMLLSVISIMISCGVYAYLFNEVGSLFNEFSKNKKQMKQNMQLINFYMHNKGINSHMQYQVRDYLEYFWKEQLDRDEEGEQNIINQLSDELKQKLLIEANKIILKDSPIFAYNFCERVIQKTISLIQEKRVLPEQIIVQEGSSENNSIFFIEKGCVEVVISNQSSPDGVFPIHVLKKGQCFEADTFFTGGTHQFTIRSKEFTTLLYIKRSDFIELLKEFPDDYEHFCVLKDQILLNSHYQLIGEYCQSCGSYKHVCQSCQYLHYCPNKKNIIKRYNKINNNDSRQEFSREQTRFNTLFYTKYVQLFAQQYLEENEENIADLVYKINQENIYKFQTLYSEEDEENNENCQKKLEEDQQNKQKCNEDKQNAPNQLQKSDDHSTKQDEGKIKSDFSSQSLMQLLPLNQAHDSLIDNQSEEKKQQNNQTQLSNNSLEADKGSEKNSTLNLKKLLQNKNKNLLSSSDKSLQDKQQQNNNNCNNNKQNIKSQNLFSIQEKFLSKIKGNNINSITNKLKNQSQNHDKRTQQQPNSNFNLMDYLQAQFKTLNINLIKNNSLDNFNKHDQHQLNNEQFIFDNFDVVKNFNIYYPFNNLDYQLQILQLPKEQRQFFTSRICLDNLLHYRKIIAKRESPYDKSNDSMNKLIKKFQQENEEQLNQQRYQFDIKSIYQQKKQSSRQKRESSQSSEIKGLKAQNSGQNFLNISDQQSIHLGSPYIQQNSAYIRKSKMNQAINQKPDENIEDNEVGNISFQIQSIDKCQTQKKNLYIYQEEDNIENQI